MSLAQFSSCVNELLHTFDGRAGRRQRAKAGKDRSVNATCYHHRRWKWLLAWGPFIYLLAHSNTNIVSLE